MRPAVFPELLADFADEAIASPVETPAAVSAARREIVWHASLRRIARGAECVRTVPRHAAYLERREGRPGADGLAAMSGPSVTSSLHFRRLRCRPDADSASGLLRAW